MGKQEKTYIKVLIVIVLCGAIKTALLLGTVCIVAEAWLVKNYTPVYDPEDYGSFTPEDTYSYDGKLLAHQKVVKMYNMKYMSVEITDSETGELVGSFYPARAWDFWGICWENDSYNIWIQSSDIGIYCYRYEDGEWVKDYFNHDIPDYIITRYDKKEK